MGNCSSWALTSVRPVWASTWSAVRSRRHKLGGPSWTITLKAWSIDFFTVPTIRFQVLYVLLVLVHDRRRVVHYNVTAHPTAEWTAQQLREAFPFAQSAKDLPRDRDRIFGAE